MKRKLFKGQFKIFLCLLKYQKLNYVKRICKPLVGDFSINVDTKNFIDACIYYTGDYEPYLKKHFAAHVKPGMTVLDVGANIGFHTLYFAELVGISGKVIAFEPIKLNFSALTENLKLNEFRHIQLVNKALGNINSTLKIHIDENATNPGAFNLLDAGEKNTEIECVKGDDYLKDNDVKNVDFIKIDVEGFELEVFKGLTNCILTFKPTIIFEYDEIYQSKSNNNPKEILYYLLEQEYILYKIDGYGKKSILSLNEPLMSLEILAIYKKNN